MNIQLTEPAVNRLRQELTKAGMHAVRLSLKEAGCSGLEYVFDFTLEGQEGDLCESFDGFQLFVDPESYSKALDGLMIDFQTDLLSSSFVFNNPNKKGECGCGISFTV
ncbi:MAG: iron-sulfur cluster assembly protein IscA [Zetaproteobacteria bacterium CG_4_9_14_3_um_filter_49_83]|nr:MAG: iron-sulfur cluster assembly protein IscA [Zetaproteobacteria bacterium CG1_02_49_23]PIQ31880.1 MAG: iron-sulfur cluster assembly protein IscA [Zetaproteobacteria bacterium CG17_big_fil_post_rev_8_21_14_2_50_50_13]PIV30447.1 MAG: iron-sulfur cluster assembly protein IscA [Zetaproteobacteria bacterium CG02_land_8_20_14_3_00_50_9]PIY55413.1 MAG: iron-sulfur cluster assembly protein IscA [Zetaproteobacteria bacterium CG_4_10_14_0_8_um_filter_49_80]PJA34572.1 MAG: iron-sulfur cluster assemb